MRYLAAILLLFAGCVPTPPKANTYTPLISVAVGVAESSKVAPQPTPEPANGVCSNCNGKGKIGDGTVFVTCPECNGTGKNKTSPPPPLPTTEAPAEAQSTPSAEPAAEIERAGGGGVVEVNTLRADPKTEDSGYRQSPVSGDATARLGTPAETPQPRMDARPASSLNGKPSLTKQLTAPTMQKWVRVPIYSCPNSGGQCRIVGYQWKLQ